MSGEKAVAINRAWEQWPTVDPEAVAEMVAAGWDAHAAQVVPQPDREAIKARLSEVIGDVYSCSRVWEAWQYGTMTQDDFSPAWEDEELLDSPLAALSPAPLTINRDVLANVVAQALLGKSLAGAHERVADAVISHLSAQTASVPGIPDNSAQTVEGEVEWEYNIAYPETTAGVVRWNPDGAEPSDSIEIVRNDLASGNYLDSDRIVRRRKAGHWTEVQS